MCYFMAHLTVAEHIAAHTLITDKTAFYAGHIAPDAIMFGPHGQRADKSASHFCVGDEIWTRHTNYTEWLANATARVRDFAGTINRDFLFGYFGHIYTDIENARHFWTPARLKQDEAHLQAYKDDCAALDRLLLTRMPAPEDCLHRIASCGHYALPGVISAQDMSLMVAYIRDELFVDAAPPPAFCTTVVHERDMTDFLASTAAGVIRAAATSGLF